ncbi:MAG: HAD family hydrolase [Bacillales bacterium]|jgi:FMN phosphatase YigB (HAD superfamily)|nr:HAD family hydrolase [Bacillales bacterium]
MIKNYIFELDQSLLMIDNQKFLKLYYQGIGKVFEKENIKAEEGLKHIYKVLMILLNNNGQQTNETLFWNYMKKVFPNLQAEPFVNYYENDYNLIKKDVDNNPYPRLIIKELNKKGYKVVIATNPLFPKIALVKRLEWAGIKEKDYAYISTYENSTYCKPKKEYFLEIINKLNLNIQESIFIGNDITDDFSDLPSDLKTLLVTDYLINNENKEINIESLTIKELYQRIKLLPKLYS